MQASVRVKCKSGAQDCYSMSTRDFTLAYPSQIALLGIQILWTQTVSECLQRSNKEKIQELDKKKKFLRQILSDLTKMCLEEWDKQTRTRIETIVTIHVRQLEIFDEIKKLASAFKIKDENDFDW